jgi:xanthine/CO dehydrogenase XdhC/CoxF family maturation factor
MTKEIKDILAAYYAATKAGRQTALATVVHVEGSSYRRPGARMLVEDNGKITGAISGGCLEGDALRKAQLAMSQKQNKVVTYNTLDPDDVDFGVQLGCNGIVHILFEPLDAAQPNNPVSLLERSFLERRDSVVVTLFSIQNNFGPQPGTCFFFDGVNSVSRLADPALEAAVKRDAAVVLSGKTSAMKTYDTDGLTGFVELLTPPVSLMIVGAGNDAIPLTEMAALLGWQTTVIDGRSTHAVAHRFPFAKHIVVAKPEVAVERLQVDEQTVFLLMTHNYHYDLKMLQLLLQKQCTYIGTLGPRKRLERMLDELKDLGIEITPQQRERIYGPTGLDIGAEAAEEIALSVLAEIKAVLAKRQGTSLRNRPESIHARTDSTNAMRSVTK